METFVKVRLKEEAKKLDFFTRFAGQCKKYKVDPNGVFFVLESSISNNYIISIFTGEEVSQPSGWEWNAYPKNWEIARSTPRDLKDFA